MKFGYCVGLGSPSEMIKQAILAEKCGFKSLWFPDHFVSATPTKICPEIWSVITAVGIQTEHAMLSTGVTDPFRRHPSTIAQTVATLDQLTNGRMALGIGAGEAMNLTPFGIHYTDPVICTREAIEYIKSLWAASLEIPANYNGYYFNLNDAFLTIRPVQKPHPPIYLGALGPKMREVVGEVADGWYSWLTTPELYQKALKDIAKGCIRVGRSLDEIDAVPRFYTAIINGDQKFGSKIVSVSKWALILERRILKTLCPTISIPDNITIQKVLSTRDNDALLEEATREIPREIVDDVSVFGTVDDCMNQIAQYIKAGAKHIGIYNVADDETLKKYQKIISYFTDK